MYFTGSYYTCTQCTYQGSSQQQRKAPISLASYLDLVKEHFNVNTKNTSFSFILVLTSNLNCSFLLNDHGHLYKYITPSLTYKYHQERVPLSMPWARRGGFPQ